MSDFNKDEYLNDLPDMDDLSGQAAPAATSTTDGASADSAAGCQERCSSAGCRAIARKWRFRCRLTVC